MRQKLSSCETHSVHFPFLSEKTNTSSKILTYYQKIWNKAVFKKYRKPFLLSCRKYIIFFLRVRLKKVMIQAIEARPATLIKRGSNTVNISTFAKFLRTLILKNICFWINLTIAVSCEYCNIFKSTFSYRAALVAASMAREQYEMVWPTKLFRKGNIKFAKSFPFWKNMVKKFQT